MKKAKLHRARNRAGLLAAVLLFSTLNSQFSALFAQGTAFTYQGRLNENGALTVNGTFNNNSDREAKQNLNPVSAARILDKVPQLPLSEWSYKEDAATLHIGPMAQDFHSAFNIGTDDKHIAPFDEGGATLAAIQGLNHKLEEKLEQKEAGITELKEQLHRLERFIHSTSGGA